MKKIVILGDCGSCRLTREVTGLCSKNGGVLFIGGGKIFRTSENPSYLVVGASELSQLELPGSIIVLGKKLGGISRDIDLSAHICVLDAENKDSLLFASGCGAQALGCSMSGHDSMTVSSFGEDGQIVIALRRSVRTDSGTISPGEFSIYASPDDNIYPVLAAKASLLVSGVSPF